MHYTLVNLRTYCALLLKITYVIAFANTRVKKFILFAPMIPKNKFKLHHVRRSQQHSTFMFLTLSGASCKTKGNSSKISTL